MEKKLLKINHDIAISELLLQNLELDSYKLTFNDMLYINIIEAKPMYYTATKLADMLLVSRPYVTQKINHLVDLKLVTKVQDPSDKRLHYLVIDKNNFPKEYSELYDSVFNKAYNKLLNHYSKDELCRFFEIMDLLGDYYLEEVLEEVKKRK